MPSHELKTRRLAVADSPGLPSKRRERDTRRAAARLCPGSARRNLRFLRRIKSFGAAQKRPTGSHLHALLFTTPCDQDDPTQGAPPCVGRMASPSCALTRIHRRCLIASTIPVPRLSNASTSSGRSGPRQSVGSPRRVLSRQSLF